MIKHIFYLIVLAVGLIFARTVGATEPMQMTMVLQPDGKVLFTMAGSGSVTIDWGDGTAIETHTLLAYDKEDWQNDWQKYAYIRAYSRKSVHTIVITGENITHLECNWLGLTSLDVTKNAVLTNLYCTGNQLMSLDVNHNTALTNLHCSSNQLTSLDISNNTALIDLSCDNNKLTSLDVSKNTALKELYCAENQLTDLNVSNNTALINLFCFDNQLTYFGVNSNTALTRLDCHNNRLSSFALNALFLTLHSDTIPEEKRICIRNNPGIDACNQSIATYKGWMVICPVSPVQNVQSEVDTTMVTGDTGNTLPLFKREGGFRYYVMRNTVYPKPAIDSGIQGIVLVEFSIDQKGKTFDAKVIQSVHPLLDAEALRVVRSSPKWTPEIQRGKKVKVKYIFPFVFKL